VSAVTVSGEMCEAYAAKFCITQFARLEIRLFSLSLHLQTLHSSAGR
jgi:hypothetical protein